MTNESRHLRQEPLFCEFMVDVLQGMIAADKRRCYETYLTTLNNFKRFLQGGDIEFERFDSMRLLSYDKCLIRAEEGDKAYRLAADAAVRPFR